MAGFDDNPFQLASADKAYMEKSKEAAIQQRATAILAEKSEGAEEVPGPEHAGSAAVGKGGIGPNVPKRNFNDPNIRPPTWFRDKEFKACVCCQITFTTFNRKHHCRGCGLVFCGPCTPEPKLLLPLGWEAKEPERVCGTCALTLKSRQHELRQHYTRTTPRRGSFAITKSVLGIK